MNDKNIKLELCCGMIFNHSHRFGGIRLIGLQSRICIFYIFQFLFLSIIFASSQNVENTAKCFVEYFKQITFRDNNKKELERRLFFIYKIYTRA